MSIVRIKKRRRFTTVHNETVEDKKLDFDALGLLVYLLSKPDSWEVSVKHLSGEKKSGKGKIERILKDLQKLGYAEYRKLHTGKVEWTIYEVPKPKNQDQEKPEPKKPDQEKPDLENRTQVNTDNKQILNNSKKESKPKKRFKIPVPQAIDQYQMQTKGKIIIDSNQFVNYYSSKGWMIGKNKMKCWRSAVNTWIINDEKYKKQNAAHKPNNQKLSRAERDAIEQQRMQDSFDSISQGHMDQNGESVPSQLGINHGR
jgi:hypothetical protein